MENFKIEIKEVLKILYLYKKYGIFQNNKTIQTEN